MIGYYAHGHGSGHCNCANIFSKVFGTSLIVLTDRKHSFDSSCRVVGLENENYDGTEYVTDDFPEPRALHYAPVNLSKLTYRNRTVLDTVLRMDVSLLIIDVSVEMAMLARVSSIPYAYVRLQGDRTDLPHLNAFEGASFLLAYYPREMESIDTPAWIVNKTIYLGFLSKFLFDCHVSERPMEYRSSRRPILAHIKGFGGGRRNDLSPLSDNFDVFAIGPRNKSESSCSKTIDIGVVDNIGPYIEHADTVVAACGLNLTSEILSLGKRFLAIPEIRHFKEQYYMAHNLDRLGWAVDTSKFADIWEAFNALSNSEHISTPEINLCALTAFKELLQFHAYRADRIIAAHYQNRGTLTSKNKKEFINI